jgi:predicted permease
MATSQASHSFKNRNFRLPLCLFPLIAPVYISSLLSAYTPAISIRPCSTTSLLVTHARLASYGERSFSSLGPTLLNSLGSLKAKLKIHLLRTAFSQ